jgi:hypothetical protein
MSAHSSATVAHAATAVIEGLANDLHYRPHKDTSVSLNYSDVDGLLDKKSKSSNISIPARAEENSMQNKIDQLREEKNRLVKELYGEHGII